MIFGNLGKMAEMMKQAKQIDSELSRLRFEGEANGVKAIVNGKTEVLEIKIGTEVNQAMLEHLIKEAVNKALNAAKMESVKIMQKMTGGLQLPGM